MNKERLAAFTDAILAIVMTILVLALDAPKEPTFAGFWDLRMSYFSYAISFFCLDSLWMGLNEVCNPAEHIDNAYSCGRSCCFSSPLSSPTRPTSSAGISTIASCSAPRALWSLS